MILSLLIKVLAVCGLCAWVSAFIPSTHSNRYVQIALDLLNLAGGNIYLSKNKDDPRP